MKNRNVSPNNPYPTDPAPRNLALFKQRLCLAIAPAHKLQVHHLVPLVHCARLRGKRRVRSSSAVFRHQHEVLVLKLCGTNSRGSNLGVWLCGYGSPGAGLGLLAEPGVDFAGADIGIGFAQFEALKPMGTSVQSVLAVQCQALLVEFRVIRGKEWES